jgi:hypothetical protein
VVVAGAQGLAVEGDHPEAVGASTFPQDLAVQAEDPLELGPVQPLQDAADPGVGRRAPPRKPETRLEPREMDLDERMDAALGVRPHHHRKDRKKHDMGQLVELAFGPARVLDLGQQFEQLGKGTFHGNRPPLGLPAMDSDKCRDSNPKSHRHVDFPGPCGISDSHQR